MGPSTNGFSIASLVLGIVWVFGLGAILAVIFGFVARKQIRESGGRQAGSGMALAGVILGFVGIAGLILWIVIIAVAVNNFDNCLNQYPNNPNAVCVNGNFNTGTSGNSLNSGSLGNSGTAANSGSSGSTPIGGSTGAVRGPVFAFF
jgi:predicted PurR-regulated permease PerM